MWLGSTYKAFTTTVRECKAGQVVVNGPQGQAVAGVLKATLSRTDTELVLRRAPRQQPLS